jgi:hypothetical protein
MSDDDDAMYRLGEIAWHSSDPDGLPDVGISVGLGDAMLYAGEVPDAPCSLVIYPMKGERQLVAHLVTDDDPARALIERLGLLLRPKVTSPVDAKGPSSDDLLEELCSEGDWRRVVHYGFEVDDFDSEAPRLAAAEIRRLLARIEALTALVREADDLIGGDLTGLQWKRNCRAFRVKARATLKGQQP